VPTLATALYARIDDSLAASPEHAPWRPEVGIAPGLSDAEALTLAVLQALLGYASEARWLRHARAHLRHLFPYLQSAEVLFEKYALSSAPSRIRTCAHGSGGRCSIP
jgi:hypothetical protein